MIRNVFDPITTPIKMTITIDISSGSRAYVPEANNSGRIVNSIAICLLNHCLLEHCPRVNKYVTKKVIVHHQKRIQPEVHALSRRDLRREHLAALTTAFLAQHSPFLLFNWSNQCAPKSPSWTTRSMWPHVCVSLYVCVWAWVVETPFGSNVTRLTKSWAFVAYMAKCRCGTDTEACLHREILYTLTLLP